MTYIPAGTPDLLLTLTNSHTISEPSFHACVQFVLTSPARTPSQALTLPQRLNRFVQLKALSFVPPDGRFTLMEYRFDPSASKPGHSASSHSRYCRATPSTSAIHITRHALHHRPRRSVPSLPPFQSPTHQMNSGDFELWFTPHAGARGRRCRALSRFRSDGRIEYGCNGWRRVDVHARKTYVTLVFF